MFAEELHARLSTEHDECSILRSELHAAKDTIKTDASISGDIKSLLEEVKELKAKLAKTQDAVQDLTELLAGTRTRALEAEVECLEKDEIISAMQVELSEWECSYAAGETADVDDDEEAAEKKRKAIEQAQEALGAAQAAMDAETAADGGVSPPKPGGLAGLAAAAAADPTDRNAVLALLVKELLGYVKGDHKPKTLAVPNFPSITQVP